MLRVVDADNQVRYGLIFVAVVNIAKKKWVSFLQSVKTDNVGW